MKRLKIVFLIVICITCLYVIFKQIFLINNLNKYGIHSEGKVYGLCATCILIDLKDNQTTHSGLKINVLLPNNYKSGDWVNVVYDKNDKNKIIVDDALQTIYLPYGALSFLLIFSTLFIGSL